MADITWPFVAGDPRFAPEGFDEAIEFNVLLAVARSGKVTTLALPGGRFRCTIQFGDESVAYLVQRRQLLAFFATLRGGADRLLMWSLLSPAPLGTMRGAPTLSGAVAAGATTAQLQACTAGGNIFNQAVLQQAWLSDWVASNVSIAYNAVPGPVATSLGTTITINALTLNYVERQFTLASTAYRSVEFAVWLKAGTYVGNVVLIIADGAAGNQILNTVTLTADWQLFYVRGVFPVSPAANIRLYIDVVDDSGVIGQVFYVWFADVHVHQAQAVNGYLFQNAEAAPAGQSGLALHLVRVATGNHFTFRSVTRSVAAGEVWTYSVWLRLGTLTGTVLLQVRDAANAVVAGATVTPTATWQRFTLTATFPNASAYLVGYVNPTNDAGSAGETLAIYGEQLEPGSVATGHSPTATLLRGDFVAFGGQRVMLTADAVASADGLASIAFQPAHRAGASSAGAVTVVQPTTRYVLTSPVLQMPARGDKLPGFAVELVEE